MATIGKALPHESSHLHSRGVSWFVDDHLEYGREVFVDFVESPVARGEILSIDLSAAEKDPDFIRAFGASDIPGKNLMPIGLGEQPVLAERFVEYLGEPVLVFAARTRECLARIRSKIKVHCQELVPILTIDEAIQKESFIGEAKVFDSKSVEKGFKNSQHLLEGVFESGSQEHFYLEAQGSIAYPDEKGHLTILSSTQHPSEAQHAVAQMLGIPYSQVVCQVKRLGGGFGGKESQATPYAAMAALVAWQLQVPARLVLSCERDMKVTGKRHAFKNFYKVGFDGQGRLQALQVHFYGNGGAYSDLSLPILDRCLFHADNAYFLPHYRLNGRICRTNLPPATAFRGFGGPQGMLNIESIIEEIARFLQIDAAEVRRINLYSGKRNLTPYRQKVDDEVLPDLFGKLLASSRYSSRRKKLAEFHGLAVTPMKFGISFTAKLLNQASSLVSLHVDGSVQVSTGAVEMGQGVQTKIRQVVADAFGLKPALVEVMITSTEKNPNTSPTAASSGSDLNGSAALLACEKIKARINEVLLRGVFKKQRSEIVYQRGLILCGKQKIDFKEAVNRAYAARVSLSEQGYYATPNLGFDPVTRRGRAFAYYTQGAAVAEVRINRWTGETRCIRSDVLIDIGASLNPGIDLGQIKGGFAQGMGWLTTEDIRYNDQGALLSSSPTTYKVPHVEDIPSDWNIRLYENRNEIPNLHRSKAVGEPPLMLAISVWCAIKDALREYKDVHTLRAPATAEEILRVIEGGLK